MEIGKCFRGNVLKQGLEGMRVLEEIWAVSENKQIITNPMICRVKWLSWFNLNDFPCRKEGIFVREINKDLSVNIFEC